MEGRGGCGSAATGGGRSQDFVLLSSGPFCVCSLSSNIYCLCNPAQAKQFAALLNVKLISTRNNCQSNTCLLYKEGSLYYALVPCLLTRAENIVGCFPKKRFFFCTLGLKDIRQLQLTGKSDCPDLPSFNASWNNIATQLDILRRRATMMPNRDPQNSIIIVYRCVVTHFICKLYSRASAHF